MEIAISFVLAFVISGVSQVAKDLGGRPLDRPFWTLQPTFWKMLLVGLTWFVRPILDISNSGAPLARSVAYGLLGATVQLTTLTAFVFGCISMAQHFFDGTFAVVVTSALLMIVGSFIVLPIVSFVILLATVLLSIPINLLFPLRHSSSPETVNCCRTCAHYRKSEEYEDLMNGLWRSESMPRSDKLPCSIPLETADTWQAYFATPQGARTPFPNGCPSFETRA